MTDQDVGVDQPFVPPAPIRVRPRLTPEPVEEPAPVQEEPKFKVVAEVVTTFDTLDAALAFYGQKFHGGGGHTVSVIDDSGQKVTSKSWGSYQDEKGYRSVTTLSRLE